MNTINYTKLWQNKHLYVLCDKKEKSLRRDTAMVEGTEVKQGEFFT